MKVYGLVVPREIEKVRISVKFSAGSLVRKNTLSGFTGLEVVFRICLHDACPEARVYITERLVVTVRLFADIFDRIQLLVMVASKR